MAGHLIHGAGGSSSIWFRQIRAFKKEFNVLWLICEVMVIKTNNPTPSKDYTFKDISNDILEVLHHLKIEKSHFVGISWNHFD